MDKPRKQSVRLRPADPFDLIRWLARSQSDPRKATAELVQNSIDAGARTIRIERRRLRGAPALVIRDDGEGVLPHMPREDAMRHIATHIGYSNKRGLSPRERHELMVAGKYGIGLLGFWAIGHRMEIRSRVAGSPLFVLRMTEDEQAAQIGPAPLPLDAPGTFTEVVVLEVHDAPLRVLGGRRLADYLAAEVRGPLLATGATVEIHDAMARGTAQRRFSVVPRAYPGERLAVPESMAVDGHAPARVELYLARGAERPAIQVACAGTLVAESVGELAALGLDREPWIGGELTGLIDFPDFTVPPGTRRGVAPDGAAAAFARMMDGLEPVVRAELKRFEHDRHAAVDRQVVDQLRRALRGLRTRLPHYELPEIARGREAAAEPAPPGETLNAMEAEPAQPELFAPGPLAAVRIVPGRIEVAPGGERRVRAIASDAEGHALRQGVAFVWHVEGAGFRVAGEGTRPAVAVDPLARPGVVARLAVTATQTDVQVQASAELVVVVPAEDDTAGAGVPKPELIDDPGASWRSRFDGERWQVNAAHEDYAALRGDPRARLRYLLVLLAKEIVQRNYGAPGTETVLERLVEVLAHAERNLKGS